MEIQDFLCSEFVETTKLSKLIHNLHAQTIDVKENNPWNYEDNLCICEEKAETQLHIFSCNSLKSGVEDSEIGLNYSDLFFGTNKEKVKIAFMFETQLKIRKRIMEMRNSDNCDQGNEEK